MIKDRNGSIIPENANQNRILHLLYDTKSGRFLLKILTRPALSRIAGKFMDSPLSVPLIRPFIRRNNIDMSQFRNEKYHSFNSFFTRKIRPECRPVNISPDCFISPCDSKLTVYPIIGRKSIFRIKDSCYRIADLIGDKKLAEMYSGGYCLIFRLGVDDYHRYCFPDTGTQTGNLFIKGELHTVNPITIGKYNIYRRNSRERAVLHTDNFGDIIQVEVGAMLVGRICNNHVEKFRRGDEKGKFEYGGSTIVVLVKKEQIRIDRDILENSAEGIETVVKYGEHIAVKIK
ncbi:MAG: phosphatidylserine decarboxylase [Ruminococcus sp.]|nr:phosphatidylserine decarboxylase [Ruminococcus sp.]MDE6784441.1 phosphatidylserine decarboxylase [Ruminococcus sp.]